MALHQNMMNARTLPIRMFWIIMAVLASNNLVVVKAWSLRASFAPTTTSSTTTRRQTTTSTTSTATTSTTTTTTTLYMTQQEDSPRQKIVIVGGGLGGLSSALDARHLIPHDKAQVVVVSNRQLFQFHPSNPYVATRQRTAKDISLDLTKILPRHGLQFVHSAVTHLDPQKQQLTLSNMDNSNNNTTIMEYDYLIIATGPRLAFEQVPGLGPNGYSVSICQTPHAQDAADAVDQLVANPGPIVIGSTQGASCFGPAYEFCLLLQHELGVRGQYELVKQCTITFVTPEPYLGHLGLKGAGKSNQILTKLFNQHHIEWYTNCKVKELTSEGVSIEYLSMPEKNHTIDKDCPTMTTTDETTTETKMLPSKFNMFIPPFHGLQVWKQVPGLTDDKGMILCNEHQQSVSYPNIFGVGVCVHLDPIETTHIPTGPPKTGYMIESMGTAAVQNIRHLIKEKQRQHQDNDDNDKVGHLPYKPSLNGLCITDFGNNGAIFLTLPQLPPRRRDVTMQGKVATLAKMAFEKYFLFKIQTGDTDPYYEKYMLHLIGVDRTERV